MKAVGNVVVALVLAFVCYAAFWAVRYRMPFGEDERVERIRPVAAVRMRVIEFRAALAANAHGFPGHAYVVFDDQDGWKAIGFVPRYQRDQLRSLWCDVPGFMQTQPQRTADRNLKKFAVQVSAQDYAKAKQLVREWKVDRFKVGERDCVAFVDAVAATCNLSRPQRHHRFPQDYVAELEAMNARTTYGARTMSAHMGHGN
jgi:hypothetical protein